jgi:penicillin-binding protein-related factor A (putative recombinase)
MKNNGKPTEALFEDSIRAAGKEAYAYRIKDAAAIRGITGRVGNGVDATPSDYICAAKGNTFFAEVKSTQDEKRFPFSLLKKGQTSHGKQIVAAGGLYLVFVHRLTTDQWYVLPLNDVFSHEATTGERSIRWEEMEKYLWPSMVASPKGNRPVW